MTSGSSAFTGTLELNKGGSGHLRDPKRNYAIHPADAIVPRELVQRYRLRGGETIVAGDVPRRNQRGPVQIRNIESIAGLAPDAYAARTLFDELSVVHPSERIQFETPDGPPSTRVIDLLTPIGKGQRGLIVAPPRSGKTVLLQHMAAGIIANHPELHLMMLLLDERPEEVTEMRRSICAAGSGWHEGHPEVAFSTNDKDAKSHVRLGGLMIDKAKRHVEAGHDAVILLDSLTRLGRAANNLVGSSGRTMTGGLDIRALELPKQLFGAARKVEHGGSLTIIASVLVETGSRMDDFIFQEFKGTGNMEIVLSRELANLRIWPSINLTESGTRKEELLLGQETYDKMSRLRRRLINMPPTRQMQTLLEELGKMPSNQEFVANLAS